MSAPEHWAAAYIGRPWVAGTHDCWAFFREVQRARFGREVPAYDVDSLDLLACARAVRDNPERFRWLPVEVPAEGDAVLLAHSRHPSHVGVWLGVDGGGVLHCVQGDGVVFQARRSLALCGWGRLSFYRWNEGGRDGDA